MGRMTLITGEERRRRWSDEDCGITVRTAHGVPAGLRRLDNDLPALAALELRMLIGRDVSHAAMAFVAVLRSTTARHVTV